MRRLERGDGNLCRSALKGGAAFVSTKGGMKTVLLRVLTLD